MRNDPRRGFSLLELVIVLAILGGLAAIALPAYRSSVLRANRSEARAALLALAVAEEKFYSSCNSYTSVLDPSAPTACAPPSLRFSNRSEHGWYGIEVDAADAASWTASATAALDGPQSADSACRVLQLASTGARSARRSDGRENAQECWSR